MLSKIADQQKSVAIITRAGFPKNLASTQRIAGVAQTFESLGYSIHVVSVQPENPPLEAFSFVNENWTIHSIAECRPDGKGLIRGAITRWRLGKSVLRWLYNIAPKPDIVIIYGSFSLFARQLRSWLRKQNIPFIVDVVEWYQPSHLRMGWGGAHHIDCEMALRYFFPKVGNMIVISQYLENYFLKRGCNVIRIPPTLDTKLDRPRFDCKGGGVQLVYAGFPGKKDLIDNIVEAIWSLDPEGEKICLTLVGPTESDVLNMPAARSRGLGDLPPFLDVRGPLPHDDAITLIKHADFVPLLRTRERYAMAGFPSKVPECMSLGTPVICNLTSDLGDYIRDGVEGIICRSHSVASCVDALERALAMTTTEREEMRKAAYRESVKSFDYRAHIEPLGRFLGSLD